MVSSLERVAVEKQNIEILVQIGAGRETECVNPPSRGFRGGINVDKSWSYGNGVAWYILAVADDLLCRPLQGSHDCTIMWLHRKTSRIWDVDSLGRVSGLEHIPTWMNLPACCRCLSSIRRELGGCHFVGGVQGYSLRAYPRGFPWVEPVSYVCEIPGIEFVRMLVALELYEIPREEVAGGAVGVVRGGFPREGAQRSKSGDCVMSSPSQPRWCMRAYAERMGPSQRDHPQTIRSLSADNPQIISSTAGVCRWYRAAYVARIHARETYAWLEPFSKPRALINYTVIPMVPQSPIDPVQAAHVSRTRMRATHAMHTPVILGFNIDSLELKSKPKRDVLEELK
ncbi:hypothetical protein DFH09DRAFT_1068463 [Mycena vulgaris]|nr:hypothetical protein DFH09DRAFT_1068463 [Mycena vulgaris]